MRDRLFAVLGDNNPSNDATPVQVSGLTGPTSISGGLRHTLGRKGDGTV